MSKKHFLLLILIIVAYSPLRAQTYSPQQIEIAERLHSLSNNAAPEIAYIQTSKDIYETGEDLWFKVYLLNSLTLIPSLLSKTLYLQLVNEENKKVVWQEKYEIQNGFANGRVYLETTLQEGDYFLAAYTPNSFFNDTAEFYAIRRIKVKTDITSQPSLSAIFNKTFYDNNDTIRIKLSPFSKPRDSLYVYITATLQQGNNKYGEAQTTTNRDGKAVISFQPQDLRKGLQVAITINYKDRKESIIMLVPCKANPIQFITFPEGGNLISGIQSKLAFKAVNIDGEPVDIKGTLFEDVTPLLEFKSTHAGMGSLDFIPIIGKKYLVRLSEPAIDSTFLLPEIYPVGITMQLVGRDKESLSFKVSQNPELEQESIYLRVQCRGVVYGMTMAKLSRELRIRVPLAGLPQGIAEVTLFNSSLVPVAERLVYINLNLKLNIVTELLKDVYPTRGKVNFKISVKDENGKPVVANLGVSVFDNHYQNLQDSNNILTHYYLSTQLKGRIYNPSFYFNGNTKNRDEALDLLLLTQGWRKYVWCETNLKKLPASHSQVIFDSIPGKIITTKKLLKTQQEQGFVLAFSPNKDNKNQLIIADSIGNFIVPLTLLKKWENDYIYLKPLGPDEFKPKIELADPFVAINLLMKSYEIIYPLSLLTKRNELISDLSVTIPGTIIIKGVTIKGKKSNLSGKYMGSLDSMAKLDFPVDYVCHLGVLNCPRHIREKGWTVPIEGQKYWFINNYNTVRESMSEVIYHSKKYVLTEEDLMKLYNLSRVKAYYGTRKFYQPNYDKQTEDDLVPDFRNTLLWEPSVITNDKGEATLSFFCSDIYTDFVGRIEGVSNEGLLGTDEFKITVRKLKLIP